MKVVRKIFIICGFAIIVAPMLFCVFWSFFFFPDDYAITQREARIASPLISEKIDVDLLQRIPQMRVFGNASSLVIEGLLNKIKQQRVLIKQEAYTYGKNAHLHVRIGTGHQGIWVDERSAILLPMGTSVYFDIEIKKGARAEFAGLSTLASGNLAVVLKSGKKFTVIEELYLDEYKQKFTAQDAVLRFINRKYPRATDDIGWKIFTIHLSKYEGRRIQLGFMNKGNSAIAIANPRIFIPAKQRRYNVIYIVFDGVSTRLWSMYNENSSLTPFMKQKAEEEFIVFDNMFALGDKTRISTVGLFCSIFPFLSRHGINRNYIPDNEIEHFYAAVRLGQFMPLPEFFRRNGYISRQFGNSGFTVQLLGTGVDYGFDASYEFSFNPYDTYGITTRFFNFLRENAGREFFVYLHYNTPHKPFYAPLRYYFKGVLNAPLASLWRPDFMGCIQYTDDVFKNLYEAFKTHGLLENSIIVVATDHGSGFDLSKFDAGFQYADYTRMMFMIYIPPRLRRELGITQKRVSPYISQLNIAPTLVEMVGMKVPKQFSGKSFLSVLRGSFNKQMFDNEIWSFGRKTFSVIDPQLYKYILTFDESKRFVNRKWAFFGEEKEVPFELLYDLKNDPHETKNISGVRKDVIKRFREKVLNRDVHHPEKNMLSFYPPQSDSKWRVDVKVKAGSSLIWAKLYRNNLTEVEDLSVRKMDSGHTFSFVMQNEVRHLVFEHRDDRTPLWIAIYINGKLLKREHLFASPLMVNVLHNPFVLQKREDFLILSSTRVPHKRELPTSVNEVNVVMSRVDLHRWIDIGKLEEKSISAGMKQTLKSWGYIQ